MGGGTDPQLVEAINEASRNSISNSRRLRMIEDRVSKLDSEFKLLKSNYNSEIKKLESQLRNVEASMEHLRDLLETGIKEIKSIHNSLSKLAPKSKVSELEEFVKLVNPTQLLTVDDVERIVRKLLEERDGRV